MGVLHILPQALVVEPPVVVLANAFLAALNGLRLLAPVTLLRGLATALDASPAKVVDALLEASTKAFLVPLVRSGLIEGGMVLRLVMCNSVSQGNAGNEAGCKELAGYSHQFCTEQGGYNASPDDRSLCYNYGSIHDHCTVPVLLLLHQTVLSTLSPHRDLPQIQRPTVSPPPRHGQGR
jgi:hypothetical protein